MPKEVEDKLKEAAEKMARKGKLRRKPGDSLEQSKDRYIYGTLNKLKMMHGNKRMM